MRKRLALPAANRLFVPLAGAADRLLHAPPQALAQKTAYMVMVIADVEMALDQRGDPVGGPEVIVPAMRCGALGQQTLQRDDLLVRERRRPARVRFGIQPVRIVLCLATPAIDGVAIDAEKFANVCLTLALFQKLSAPADGGVRVRRTFQLVYSCTVR